MNGEPSTIRALVRGLEGNRAIVEVEQGGCGGCQEEGGCGGQQLTQMFCSGPRTYHADNDIGAAVGERVVVAIAPGSVRKIANLAYILPLTVAIAFAIVGMNIGGDPGAMIGALFGLVGAYAYIRQRSRRASRKSLGRPHIVARC